jgi:hypothetical protein
MFSSLLKTALFLHQSHNESGGVETEMACSFYSYEGIQWSHQEITKAKKSY